ncbi:YbaB/EbfC family nucleoid-associated protein [Lentzea sp. JNUCC 0626]|uniref:YbaB/EbfC family nucleoid-associated protein n=1 Tax=Lentzea sp. JNUCC 0626 TaxID=3367513 RepID=UPI00374866A1
MDPQVWIEDYEGRLAELKAKSDGLNERYEAMRGRVTSEDGRVTVEVGPNGGLLAVELGRRAYELAPDALGALIVRTAGHAQRQTASRLLEVFQELGADTEAMRFVQDSIPADGENSRENAR